MKVTASDVILERSSSPAVDSRNDAVLAARAALRRALAMRRDVEQFRALVARLEAERKPTA